MNKENEITAYSEPDYDGWGPDSYWRCSDWLFWHKTLKQAFGQQKANEIWMRAWDKQGPWDYAINACRYNNDFVHYFLSQGIDVRSFISALYTNLTDVVVNTTDQTAKLSRNLNWMLPVAGGLLVLGAGMYFANNVDKIKKVI